jgi:dUTP pyrophosphatase
VRLPTIAYKGDAGFDCYYSGNIQIVPPRGHLQVKLGIAIEVEQDEVAVVSERSGHAIRYGLTTIGNIIDSNYRGEISCIIQNNSDEPFTIFHGDKICQIIVCKLGSREIIEVEELSKTERGEKAHMSSGK